MALLMKKTLWIEYLGLVAGEGGRAVGVHHVQHVPKAVLPRAGR